MKSSWLKIIVLLTIIFVGSLILYSLPTKESKDAASLLNPTPSLHPTTTKVASNNPSATIESTIPTRSISNSPTPVKKLSTPLSCWSGGGIIERFSMESKLLPNPLEFRVYTPPCYLQEPDRFYPVIYILHGQSYTDDQWDRLGIDEIADDLIQKGEIPPLIIIMPRDRTWTQPPENLFGDALVAELLPKIDSDYRTINNRSYRAIGGLSRGANWAVHIGLTSWELFGAIGAHSYPMFSKDGPRIPGWLDDIPSDQYPRIYLDSGGDDPWKKYTLWFEEQLTKRNIPHEWNQFTGHHTESYWSAHVETYLRWYAQEW